MARRIACLRQGERVAIIERSPLEAAAFQGEGFHVFRKDVPGIEDGYVTSLGEISGEAAEDWIIAQWLESEDAQSTGAS